jgi:hypothetical protein
METQESMPHMTSNIFEVTAYYLLFDIEPDEWRIGGTGKPEVVAVYKDKSKLPHKRKIMVSYRASGVEKEVPLLTLGMSKTPDFQTTFNTIKHKEVFKRIQESRGHGK